MQVPAAVVVVRQHDARILGDDVVVNAEDSLRVHAHPRHLHDEKRNCTVKLQPDVLIQTRGIRFD